LRPNRATGPDGRERFEEVLEESAREEYENPDSEGDSDGWRSEGDDRGGSFRFLLGSGVGGGEEAGGTITGDRGRVICVESACRVSACSDSDSAPDGVELESELIGAGVRRVVMEGRNTFEPFAREGINCCMSS
jgi:hypothetical protein